MKYMVISTASGQKSNIFFKESRRRMHHAQVTILLRNGIARDAYPFMERLWAENKRCGYFFAVGCIGK